MRAEVRRWRHLAAFMTFRNLDLVLPAIRNEHDQEDHWNPHASQPQYANNHQFKDAWHSHCGHRNSFTKMSCSRVGVGIGVEVGPIPETGQYTRRSRRMTTSVRSSPLRNGNTGEPTGASRGAEPVDTEQTLAVSEAVQLSGAALKRSTCQPATTARPTRPQPSP